MAKSQEPPASKRFAKRQESISFRPSADTREYLEKAATAANHSLSSEIDLRLRLSYLGTEGTQKQLRELFGSSENLGVGFLIARLLTAIENLNNIKWLDDDNTNEQAIGAVLYLLLHFSREGARVDREDLLNRMRKETEAAAKLVLKSAGKPAAFWWPLGQGPQDQRDEFAFQVQALVGDAVDDLMQRTPKISTKT